ncbi:MAG: hypothetical protein ACI9OH_000872 [Oleispira sp.]|jgi:hypothetical protein
MQIFRLRAYDIKNLIVACGNRIYHFNPDDLSTVKLKLKPISLANDALFNPTAHIWVCEKLSWYQVPEGVAVFDKQP